MKFLKRSGGGVNYFNSFRGRAVKLLPTLYINSPMALGVGYLVRRT